MAKKKTKTKRVVVRVKWSKGYWVITNTGEKEGMIRSYRRKKDAVRHARYAARNEKRSQLMIHLKNGKFETEHTYGDDPRRSKG